MEMQYRTLGNSGLRLSVFSYGSLITFGNQVGLEEAQKLMQTAYDAGVNFFDNAEVYTQGKSEEIMGQALRRLGWSRDSYCVSSKVFFGGQRPTQRGLHRKHIVEACHAALRRLQVEYLDLYFCHRPDHHTPIVETVRAMHTLVLQGKILYWGTSEWSADQIRTAYSVAQEHHLTPPTMEQPEYNLFERQKMEREYLDLFRDDHLGTTIWSPLASGILTGKYNRGIPKDTRMKVEGYQWLKERLLSPEGKERLGKVRKLTKLADEIGIKVVHLALGWCLQNPNVSTVILGASKVSQLKENLKTLEVLDVFTPEVMERIEGIMQTKPQLPMQFE